MAGEDTPLLYQFPRISGVSRNATIADGLSRLASVPHEGSLNLNLDFLLSIRLSESAAIGAELQAVDVAYSLVMVLQLRHSRITSTPPALDVYSKWSHAQAARTDRDDLERLAQELWARLLLEYRSDQDIDCVLWTPFEKGDGSARKLRAIDYLAKAEPPLSLLSHPLVEAAIERRWKSGRSYSTPQNPRPNAFERIEAKLASPRVIHLLVVIFQLGYLCLLASYLLDPPDRVTTQLGHFPRSNNLYLILIMLVPSILSSFLSSSRFLLAVTLLIFGLTMPTCPQPGDGFFETLLVIFGLHIVLLHLPTIPSPALLRRPSESLPLSIFMVRNITNALPAFGFFGPAFVISIVLLSFSLGGHYRLPSKNDIYLLSAAPIETRWGFMIIAFVISSLWVLGTFMSSLILPTLDKSDDVWDRYGTVPGKEAKLLMVLACIKFDTPYIFPSPLNMVSLVFITPLEYCRKFSIFDGDFVHRWRVWLWRIFVLPFLVPAYIISRVVMYN